MKKENIISIRVDAETKGIIQSLSKADDRTTAWMARKLMMEALEKRGLLKKKSKPSKSAKKKSK